MSHGHIHNRIIIRQRDANEIADANGVLLIVACGAYLAFIERSIYSSRMV